ncbi:Mitochondrial inner membrane translocase subunit Tim17/Tim22/Tim23/peroxisomal protein PMP24 [Macleaya cordata]|uniref:Mitochondrial inner membrane translocase subunit Tim17/Tim22/Tim23/peroxisomal protein PMP24 n=1 Tax=Macleaya cordata TaxID=56857 RepID=A0A200Q648_MACCD|nr:Mitochondrial inner membrane translocase subunit Tim17/Tim22/Tim23/peroxisomal protein PMP24 [Macleaya cordata]
MPRSRFSGSLSSPKIDFAIDMGNPFLNLTVDGFLKIGTVAATKVVVEETYHCLRKGPSPLILTYILPILEMNLYSYLDFWTVAGVYVGMEYGMERIRGTRDWKNAMLGGAVTGALVSAASNNNREKIVMDAIAGGAIATAAEFINCLT